MFQIVQRPLPKRSSRHISIRSFAEFADFAASEIKDIDWVEHVQRSWKPMNLGQGFQVLLPWHDGPSGGATSNGRLVLRLEGGAAFGLGDHPTTQGAVEFLEKALRGHRWQSFVGTAGLIAIDYIDYIVINDNILNIYQYRHRVNDRNDIVMI